MPVQVICSYESMPACVQSVCRRHSYSVAFSAVQFRTAGRTQRTKFETITHSLVDLGAVAPFVRLQRHHSVVVFGINRQRAIDRLFRYSHEIESAFAVVGPAGSIRAVRPTLPQGS
jgi:hypothetical protein